MSLENSIDDSVQKVKDQDHVAPFEVDQVQAEIANALSASRESEEDRGQAIEALRDFRNRVQREFDSTVQQKDKSQLAYLGELERHLTAIDYVLNELS